MSEAEYTKMEEGRCAIILTAYCQFCCAGTIMTVIILVGHLVINSATAILSQTITIYIYIYIYINDCVKHVH